jgi:hypothetical protein
MRIEIVRSGGFAGMTRRREIDTATLPPGEAARMERLARAAEREPPGDAAPSPDAFEHAVTIDGRRYVVRDPRGAWRALLEALG